MIISQINDKSGNYFIISFEQSIIIIDNESSFPLLNNFFSSKEKLNICFLKDTKNVFDQNFDINYDEIIDDDNFIDERNSFNDHIKIKWMYNYNIRKIWKTVSTCISAYLIKKAYFKANFDRIANFYQQTEVISIRKDIQNNEYIVLREIGIGSKFQPRLIYFIEEEQLRVLKCSKEDYEYLNNREKNNYSKLNHPLIPKYYGINANNEIIIEYINGKTLKDVMNQLDFNDKIKIILQLLIIIGFIHCYNFIYRDLKTDNIMITKDKDVVLIDFDSMISINDIVNNTTFDFTDYAAYEVKHSIVFSYESDIYSIGVIISEMLEKKNDGTDVNSSAYTVLNYISKRCAIVESKSRPTFYGLIYYILDYFDKQIEFKYLDDLLNLNVDTLFKKSDINEENPYKQTVFGFVLLKDCNDMEKYNLANKHLKNAEENFTEAYYVLDKLFEEEQRRKKDLENYILENINNKNYNIEQKKNEMIRIKKNIYFYSESNLNDPYLRQIYNELINVYAKANQNDNLCQFKMGVLFLGIVNDINLSKEALQTISIDKSHPLNLNFLGIDVNSSDVNFSDIKKNLDLIKKIHIKRNIKKGIYFIEKSADNGNACAQFLYGFLGIINGYKYQSENNEMDIQFLAVIMNYNKSSIQNIIHKYNQISDFNI